MKPDWMKVCSGINCDVCKSRHNHGEGNCLKFNTPTDSVVRLTSYLEEKEYNRTFTTIQDFYDLKKKAVEKGEWESFLLFAAESFNADKEMMNFTNWLINPDRCQTVADWLRGRER